jgi:hypothetical protein
MDDLIDRALHYATLPLWGPACVVMRALDACMGETYDRALGVAAASAERVAVHGVAGNGRDPHLARAA